MYGPGGALLLQGYAAQSYGMENAPFVLDILLAGMISFGLRANHGHGGLGHIIMLSYDIRVCSGYDMI